MQMDLFGVAEPSSVGPLDSARDNEYGRATTVEKLNGKVYTPDELAAKIVARIAFRQGARILDPACGDGAFLKAVADRCERQGINVHLEGWDLDAEALEVARQRVPTALLSHRDALEPHDGPLYDHVIGNPPYLEAKRMADVLKSRIRKVAPTAAKGAFDLYCAFIELATRWTKPDGEVRFIVPNRILVTGYGEGLRRLLLDGGRVDVVDLSETDAFGDAAAVYPILLSWSGRGSGYSVSSIDGVEYFSMAGRPAEVLDVLPLPSPGVPGTLLSRVLATGFPTIGEAFDIRWSVSFHRSGLRDQYISTERPETSFARRFLGGGRFAGNREVQPFNIAWSGTWIDYDEGRAKADGNPLPPLSLFEQPKAVVCQNARRARAALDKEGLVLKDTFLAVVRADGDETWLAWLMLVLHSDLFHVLYEQMFGGTRKGGGYLHFLGRYLSVMPIPPIPDRRIVEELHDEMSSGHHSWVRMEGLVRDAFRVTAAEVEWLNAQEFPAH